jgi:tetratricopeptide (TPR) repeat protein
MMLQEEPDNPAWLLYYGRETHGTGDIAKALSILETANEQAKRNPAFARRLEILMMLVIIHLNVQQLDEAKMYGEEALQLRPDFPDALFYMGQIEMGLAYRLYHSAELHFRKAKQVAHTYRGVVSPDRHIAGWKADLALGDIARRVGKPSDAKAVYDSILRRVPDSSEPSMLTKQRLELLKSELHRMNQP